jgi:hypothetical protein
MLVGTSYKIGTFEKLYFIKYQQKYSDFMLHLRYYQTNMTFHFQKSRKLAIVVNFCVFLSDDVRYHFFHSLLFSCLMILDVLCLTGGWECSLIPILWELTSSTSAISSLSSLPNLWHLLWNLWWHKVAVWILLLVFWCSYFSLFANSLVDLLIINSMLPFSIVR